MKRKNIFTAGSILILIIVLLMSTAQAAFAAETAGKWLPMASMSTARYNFQTEVVNGKIYAIGGYDGKNYLSSVEEYDPITDKWTTKTPMSTQRYSLQTEVINGKIYAIGGVNGSDYLSTVEEYNPSTDKWMPKASMAVPRVFFQTKVVNGKIYAIGGYNNKESYLSSVEEYDPITNIWTPKQSMSTERTYFQTEVENDKIYAIGGLAQSQYLSSVEEYDVNANKWISRNSMNFPRDCFATDVINGSIYAFGGRNDSELLSVEEYDPTSNTWITRASMSAKRQNFRTEVIDGKIYAFSGGDNSVEEYDPTANTWTTKAPMSITRANFSTEVINGRIYAIGGRNNTGVLSSMEEYSKMSDPTLTLTASSEKVKAGQQFTTSIDIHNVTNICAEDIIINYDKDLFTYAGAEAQTGLKIYKEDTSVPGTVRFISACQGKENAATGDKGLITLKFTAKKEGTGKVDIVKGRIADNATLEMDVAEANCGEDTVTVEGYADVNRNGEFTLLDLGIDGWYNGMNAADTDTVKFNADIVADGKIDDNDLAEITKGILSNSNYTFNTSLS